MATKELPSARRRATAAPARGPRSVPGCLPSALRAPLQRRRIGLADESFPSSKLRPRLVLHLWSWTEANLQEESRGLWSRSPKKSRRFLSRQHPQDLEEESSADFSLRRGSLMFRGLQESWNTTQHQKPSVPKSRHYLQQSRKAAQLQKPLAQKFSQFLQPLFLKRKQRWSQARKSGSAISSKSTSK